jgi:hypothetical protein
VKRYLHGWTSGQTQCPGNDTADGLLQTAYESNGIGARRWGDLFYLIIDKNGDDLMMGSQSKQGSFGLLIPIPEITEEKNEASRPSRFKDAIES